MTTWTLDYHGWDPEEQPLREALCTLGNGYFATRGAAAEAVAGGPHYPGTYIAGGYNRQTTEIAGREVENEDLVNWPNWLRIAFRHAGDAWFRFDDFEILEYRRTLDFRNGILHRRFRVRDERGRTSRIEARRLVSLAQPHLAAIEWSFTAEDWEGQIELRSEIDADVVNDGVARYRDLNGQHLRTLASDAADDGVASIVTESNQSRLRVALAIRNRIYRADQARQEDGRAYADESAAGHAFDLDISEGETVTLEKICCLYTQRDHAISEPQLEAVKSARSASRFDTLLDDHGLAWKRVWDHCDLELCADEDTQRVLRLHVFHMLQTTSLHTVALDVGVPARGWHGEAYRGHIFWDELFIFPYLTLRIPELTRTLLIYRYRRLSEARRAAGEAGYEGAMYPWQSGSNGREESQRLHLNPRSGRWIPDNTHLQRHINAAIVYNVWKYYQATKDDEFLSFYGAEMMLEIARFWGSIAIYNEDRSRYDICGVVGPDEYHTRAANLDEPGLRNNAYTNLMAAWSIRRALDLFELLPEDRCLQLRRALGIDDGLTEHWRDVSARLHVPFLQDGIISQFEGYDRLEEFDWDGYRSKYGDIQRLDRILEAENDTPNRYKASKQADVLMLFYLFSTEELTALFEQLGYAFDPESIGKNIRYHQARTSHGSTLSRVVSAWVLARSQRERSWSWFKEALRSDVEDIQGGTTSEGIHLGAMAGVVDIAQRCYTGLELRDDTLWLNPRLPRELESIALSFRFRGHTLLLTVNREVIEISSCRGGPEPIKIAIRGETRELYENSTRCEDMPGETPR